MRLLRIETYTTTSAIADKLADAYTNVFARGRHATVRIMYSYRIPNIWRSQWGGSPRAIGFIFDMGKLERLGYNLVKVAWWSTQSFGNNTSTWQTHRQPRRYSNSRPYALRQAAKIVRGFLAVIGFMPMYRRGTRYDDDDDDGRINFNVAHSPKTSRTRNS